MEVGPKARAAGFSHRRLDSVGSTNAEALAIGRDRLWVTAGEQTAGRGRRGRIWASQPGNLYASLLLRDPAPPRQSAQLCFVAALALSDAILVACPAAEDGLRLKWPNDVLWNGAKIAGILIEAVHGAGQLSTVIGLGVNLSHHPEGLAYKAAHLAMVSPGVDQDQLFAALSDAMAGRLAEWSAGAGFDRIRRGWLERAAGLGGPIVVRLPQGDLDGVFESVDPDGSLMLRERGGALRPVSAGEVFFGAAGEAERAGP